MTEISCRIKWERLAVKVFRDRKSKPNSLLKMDFCLQGLQTKSLWNLGKIFKEDCQAHKELVKRLSRQLLFPLQWNNRRKDWAETSNFLSFHISEISRLNHHQRWKRNFLKEFKKMQLQVMWTKLSVILKQLFSNLKIKLGLKLPQILSTVKKFQEQVSIKVSSKVSLLNLLHLQVNQHSLFKIVLNLHFKWTL